MNFSQLIGLTSQDLYETIINSPTGFSVEDGCLQYLGRQIQLQDELTVFCENTSDSKDLLNRMVIIKPDFKTLLPDSKTEAIQCSARKLMYDFDYVTALNKSPSKEVQFAVIKKLMDIDTVLALDTICKTDNLSVEEKLRFFLIAEEKRKRPVGPGHWKLSGIPLSVRLQKTKELFQNIPGTPPYEKTGTYIHDSYIKVICGIPIKDTIKELREAFKSEDNELSRQLLKEVDHIDNEFTPKVSADGTLQPWHIEEKFTIFVNNLLYLYAASSGFSTDNVDELASYIRSLMYGNSYELSHCAKELCYLSKQPRAMGYSRYIHAVADILKTPKNVVSEYEKNKQLVDTRGFSLLQSQKTLTPYLTTLKADIENMVPEYSEALLPEVTKLEHDFAEISLPKDEPGIRAKVHRLLMIIAACKTAKQKIDSSLLAPYVQDISGHGTKNNIPYLIKGLAYLVQSTPKIQQILSGIRMRGGDHLRLAPLQLLPLVPDIISEDSLEELCYTLQASAANRRLMKDCKVFHQWLATLELVSACEVTDEVMPILKELTQSMTFEKLGLLYVAFKLEDRLHEFLERMGLNCPKEGLPLLIAKKGGDVFVGKSKTDSQWLLQQRHFHLLPTYLASMEDYCSHCGNTELVPLIQEFIKTCTDNTFIENRQSPLNNRHLMAVYQKYPLFIAGWRANFSNFSQETRNKLLSPGETLELTEDPWDLFISGLEVKTCLSPDSKLELNQGLMGYVMDGRNAMIVRKSKKGNILSRSLIRMVLDQDDRPALLLEMAYPEQRNLLYIDAARDIADEMKLPLYHRKDPEKDDAAVAGENVKLLEGRAPLEYFDLHNDTMKRQELVFSKVKRDARHTFWGEH